NETVRKGFVSGEFSVTIDSICQRTRARYLSILQSRNFKSNRSMKTAKKNQVTPERLMQFGFAYAPPLIITAAVSNKVFDPLSSESKTLLLTAAEKRIENGRPNQERNRARRRRF